MWSSRSSLEHQTTGRFPRSRAIRRSPSVPDRNRSWAGVESGTWSGRPRRSGSPAGPCRTRRPLPSGTNTACSRPWPPRGHRGLRGRSPAGSLACRAQRRRASRLTPSDVLIRGHRVAAGPDGRRPGCRPCRLRRCLRGGEPGAAVTWPPTAGRSGGGAGAPLAASRRHERPATSEPPPRRGPPTSVGVNQNVGPRLSVHRPSHSVSMQWSRIVQSQNHEVKEIGPDREAVTLERDPHPQAGPRLCRWSWRSRSGGVAGLREQLDVLALLPRRRRRRRTGRPQGRREAHGGMNPMP